MCFSQQLLCDMQNTFLNKNEYAKDITYIPQGKSPKLIKAIIVSSRLNTGKEDSARILRNQMELYIANDAVGGIVTVNKGLDTIEVSEQGGSAPITWRIIDILQSDSSCWHLLAQK